MANQTAATAAGKKENEPLRVYLVPLPKIIFLYPTFFMSLFAGIFTAFSEGPGTGTYMVTAIFLVIFVFNLIVLSFDFPRTTSITWVAVLGAIILAGILFFTYQPDLWPSTLDVLKSVNPYANATFYFLIATTLGCIYLAVLLTVQFDYWEVTPNELLHHHGILSDLERFSAPNLRLDKEINDLFEYFLLGSGRLILHPSQERRAIVLENVAKINKKERQIKEILSALQVKVRTEDSM